MQTSSPRRAELFWLLLHLVGDREGDLILFDARVEDLTAKQRGRLRFEEDAGSLLLDHLVVLGGNGNDAELEVRLRPPGRRPSVDPWSRQPLPRTRRCSSRPQPRCR